jgi:hypothetical protein
MVELLGSYPRGRLDLSSISKALSCQGFSSKQSPPPLLQVEPARSHGYEHLLHSRVVLQPLCDGWTLVARKIVSDQIEVAARVCLGTASSDRKYPLVLREGALSVRALPSRTRNAP